MPRGVCGVIQQCDLLNVFIYLSSLEAQINEIIKIVQFSLTHMKMHF